MTFQPEAIFGDMPPTGDWSEWGPPEGAFDPAAHFDTDYSGIVGLGAETSGVELGESFQGLDLTTFADRYPGYAYILKLDDPGLITIVNNWIAQYNTEDSDLWTTTASDADKLAVLMGQVEQSNWYQTHDETHRAALIMEITDHGTWLKRIEENKEEILQAARALGINVDADLDQLARTSMLEGWSQDELEEELANELYAPNLQPTTGSLRALYTGLLGFGNSQLIGRAPEDLWRMAWDITRGQNTLENAYQEINQASVGEWQLSDFDLNSEYQQSGTTMAKRLAGVQGTIARLWDLAPSELNLMELGPDQLVVTEDGKRRLMNSHEAILMARQDDRFLNSSVYKGEVGAVGSGLMRMFQ